MLCVLFIAVCLNTIMFSYLFIVYLFGRFEQDGEQGVESKGERARGREQEGEQEGESRRESKADAWIPDRFR